jgi:hypothetical protein
MMSGRREWLLHRIFRLALLGLGGATLAACNLPISPPAPTPTLALTPILTDNSLAPVATRTPLPTPIPTATPLTCVRLLTPENGAKLKGGGKVTFSWEPMPDAAVYWLEIMLPSGQKVTFDTRDRNSRDQYLEAFELDGVYYWQVSVLSHGGGLFCTSDSFVFEKGD